MTRNFMSLLHAQWAESKFVCVGLDAEMSRLPSVLPATEEGRLAFNKSIVDATKDLVCSYKPNSAFYEQQGEDGWRTMRETVQYINHVAPNVPVILDAKRADIDNTNVGYVNAVFENIGADAVTLQPYLGAKALAPFLERADKGIIVLARTSNQGAGEFQDLNVDGEPLYLRVAQNVANEWNGNGNCCLVVGATYPDEARQIRERVGDMPFLIPGIGAQGGDLEKTVQACRDSNGKGMIISSSRGIIFASNNADFAEAARNATLDIHNAITAVPE